MKKVVIYVEGQDYQDLANAAEHAVHQLRMGTPSESVEWEGGSSVDYTVEEEEK